MTVNNTNNGNKTPRYRLQANAVHSRLNTMCRQWMQTHRPEVVDKLRRKAWRDVKEGGSK